MCLRIGRVCDVCLCLCLWELQEKTHPIICLGCVSKEFINTPLAMCCLYIESRITEKLPYHVSIKENP